MRLWKVCAAAALMVVLPVLIVGHVAEAADTRLESAQRGLADQGFDPGPIDGRLGPRTRKAIRDFQRANNLEPDGILGPVTWKALRQTKRAESRRKTSTNPPARLINYRTLNWRPPQSGAETLSRFRRQTGSPEMSKSREELIVTSGDAVYVVEAGESIPGFSCDPLKGRIEMEIMLEPGGPLVFRPVAGNGFCRLGFGILLEIGQKLDISVTQSGREFPSGTVEVARQGLRYVE